MPATRGSRLTAAALMIAGLTLAAPPLAASAHTGNLFTWAYRPVANGTMAGFATLSQASATITMLPDQTDDRVVATGAEICGDVAWAVGQDPAGFFVADWNHTTGAFDEKTDLRVDYTHWSGATGATVLDAWSADSLADCTRLALVSFTVEFPMNNVIYLALASVDPETGETTPLVLLPSDYLGDELVWAGIATDPTTNTTYVFADIDGPFYSTVNLTAGTYSPLVAMEGPVDLFDASGYVVGADYEPSGTLWLTYWNNGGEVNHLLSYAPGSALATAVPTDVGRIPNGDAPGPYATEPEALAFDPGAASAAGPASGLPATGPAPSGALVAGILLVLAGAGIAFVRPSSRRTASSRG